MTPIFQHLIKKFPELQAFGNAEISGWDIQVALTALSPEFYTKIIGFHPHLNMEYSILCQKIRHDLMFPDPRNKEQLVQSIKEAIKFADLLDKLNSFYLIVPREVRRLRNHKKIYKDLLADLEGVISEPKPILPEVDVGLSLSQLIREDTGASNWYRILLSRTKRIFNAIIALEVGSESLAKWMAKVDPYLNPFLAYLGWCFFIPRLSTNLFLLLKHTIPHHWMSEEEYSLGWSNRLLAQLQRRWFELANDSVWCTVGLLNCFLLVGPLAPIGVYLTIGAFVFDVINLSVRAWIELHRLDVLKKEYQELYRNEGDEKSKQEINEYLRYIESRIQFEKLRSGLAISGAMAVVFAMCLTMPLLLASGPMLPFVAAVSLIIIWAAMYILTNQLEQLRPKDAIEKPSPTALSKFGIFATKVNAQPEGAKPGSIKGIDRSSVDEELGEERPYEFT